MRKEEGMKKRFFGILAALLLIVQVMPVAAAEGDTLGLDNLSYSFEDVEGNQVSLDSSGKPKLLVFFMTGCVNCQNTLKDIANSSWLTNGEAEVCAIEVSEKSVDEVKGFRTNHCNGSSAITFVALPTARQGYNCMDRYRKLTDSSASVNTTPLTVMLDKDNKIQYMTEGQQSASDIETKYLPTLKAGGGTNSPDQSSSSSSEKKTSKSSSSKKKPKKSDETVEVVKEVPPCDHVGESKVISQGTATSDALAAVHCVKCGAVLSYETVSNSAYATFLKETANAILNAQQNGEAVVNTKTWTSFNKAVFEAMKSRPDVKVTVNYVYKGNPYVLNIPANANVDSFMDENGFGGFRYIEHVLNTK